MSSNSPVPAASGSDPTTGAQRAGPRLGAEPIPSHVAPVEATATTAVTATSSTADFAVKVERQSSSRSPEPRSIPYVASFKHSSSPASLDETGDGDSPVPTKGAKARRPPGKPTARKSRGGKRRREEEQAEDDEEEEENAQQEPSPAASSGKNANTRHHHHPDIWEAHKAEIQDIYLKQNKPLKEVISIMKEKGFKATTRMYKSKFEQWGFAKNNRKKDVAMMLRLQQQRDATGKTTTFSRHGRSIDIANYMRRKRITKAELVKLSGVEDEASLPEYLRALTPPPSDPEHITLSGDLYTQDVLLTCFRDLTRTWKDSATSTMAFMHDFSVYFDGEICEAGRDFSRACWFFSRGHTAHGALLSQRAFAAMHLIISQPSAMGLFDLLIASVLVPDAGLAQELWKYLAAYAEMVLGPSSNLCRLFRALDDVFRSQSIEFCTDFIYNCLESIVGMLLATPFLAETVAPTISLFLIADLVLFRSTRRNLPSLQRASATARQFAAAGSPNSNMQAPVLLALLEPATQLWLRGYEDERSFQFAFGTLRYPGMLPPSFEWVQWLLWQVVAGFHRSRYLPDSRGSSPTTPTKPTAAPQGRQLSSSPYAAAASDPRHALARYSLEQAINAAEGRRGFGEFQVFENLQLLEDWHQEAGDWRQQAVVRQRKELALQQYLESLQANSPPCEIPRTPTSQ